MFDTSFQKKTLYASITGLFIGLILLGCPFFIYATSYSIIDEDFESFDIGALNGQGYWTTNLGSGDVSEIQTGVSRSGKAIHILGNIVTDPAGGSYTLPDPSISRTIFKFWFRTDLENVPDYDDKVSTGISIIDDQSATRYLYFCDTAFNTRTIKVSNTPLSTCTGGVGSIVANTWVLVEAEFDPTNDLWRARVDNSEWSETSFFNSYITIFTIKDYWTATENIYFDDFGTKAGVCMLGACSNCDTGESCLENECIWEYLPTYDRWECHNVWIPYVPGCGTGFQESCYGCYTQETCESAVPTGVCEWVDKGYGLGCYPTEEVPEEAVWEVPTLEECGELSGVEKWLCEIKNWLAGLFMPTQEKVNNLKITIDNFKAKFPFNYANSLSVFFDTIKTSLATPKDIPVEIFGNSGNLNFGFLEATGTIGGTSETIKNILYDFTTALIVIGFLFWIISFIKRIF